MSSFNDFTNCGERLRSAYLAIGTLTAAGTGDNTKVTTAYIDKNPSVSSVISANFRSAKLIIPYTATLAAAATLSFTVTPRDAASSVGAGVADYTYSRSLAKTVVATGPGGGGTVTGTVELDLDLSACREFIGFDITPDLSASGTDTATWAATLVFGGSDRSPVTQTL